ncbi:MAG: F0F1 ATP synthase subunit B [Flavobacteriales bacterium]|nr:F0F1 ATP synthase subunit B [Flavobacteriales bacterium]
MKLIEEFSFGLFFWQAFILIVLILLLVKFAWKPIMESITAREEGIQDAIDAAKQARDEMKNLQADNERILKEARIERDELLKDARAIREKMIADAKGEAEEQGQRMIEQAKLAINGEKAAAMAELKAQVSTLSVEIAEKLIKQELSAKGSQEQLVDKLLEEVKLN